MTNLKLETVDSGTEVLYLPLTEISVKFSEPVDGMLVEKDHLTSEIRIVDNKRAVANAKDAIGSRIRMTGVIDAVVDEDDHLTSRVKR